MIPLNLFLFCILYFSSLVWSTSTSIDSTGSFNCASDANSAVIKVTDFVFKFDSVSHSVYYSATGTASETVNATAKISLFMYGINVANNEVKFCEDGVSELCPITKNTDVTITGNHTVPESYVSSISTLAYTIPDLEGQIYIELYDVDDETNQLGCFRSDITNGNTTEVASAKWGTAVAAIIALVVAMSTSATSQAGGGATAPTDGGASNAAAAGTTAAGGKAAATAAAPTSGPGTNVAAGGFHAPGVNILVGWLQTMSINGVYSVDYPKVYRSFTRNFSWTCGVLEWTSMEKSIDSMRSRTGGNLTESSVEVLQNTTLYEDPLTSSSLSALSSISSNSTSKRAVEEMVKRYDHANGYFTIIKKRSSIPTTSSSTTSVGTYSKYVTGIEAYLEKNNIPFTNGFVTLLIWWCIIVAGIVFFMLVFKYSLELYYTEKRVKEMERRLEEYESTSANQTQDSDYDANQRKMSKSSAIFRRLSLRDASALRSNSIFSRSSRPPTKPKFQGYRENYRNYLRITLIRVIVILYGVWVLLSLYQFRIKDSWATILLAALTFSIFTFILMAFALRIWYLAYIASKKQAAADEEEQVNGRRFSTLSGAHSLFHHKPWISRYGVFYDEFKVDFWWVFMIIFLAVFGRNAFIALGVGHPLIQIFGQLAIDVVLCVFFCIYTPFNTKMGNGLNIIIQVVRIVSLILTFLFTDVVSMSRIKSTVVGFVLIALQSSLTVILVLLILANACKGMLNTHWQNTKQKRRDKRALKLALKNQEKRPIEEDVDLLDLGNDEGDMQNKNSIKLIDLDSPTGSDFDEYDDARDGSGSFMDFRGPDRPRRGSIFVEDPNLSQYHHHDHSNQNVFSDNFAIDSGSISNKSRITAVDPFKTSSRDDDEFDFIDFEQVTKPSDKEGTKGLGKDIIEDGFKLNYEIDDGKEDSDDERRLLRNT
ncbi:hypothetical protein DASC09_049740 [Saccharomycopsis crataegensis]|uniref:ML-like domain-containing protein n=1 Tax=Saccharomycopsis crataegensis TaxID=43959 RepID=A0AAV5QT30_9ASCO|nr:hypothetical protein DASC09_049740 [Saccharomycopsis crataegensis]